MIHGYHATFSTYGCYLPNDPRGSKSKFFGGRKLYETGGKVKTDSNKNYAQLTVPETQILTYAQSVLKRPTVVLTETQIAVLAASLAAQFRRRRLTVWAVALMLCHVHLFSCAARLQEAALLHRQSRCAAKQVKIGRRFFRPAARPNEEMPNEGMRS